jgi:hypothetical protein
MRLGLRVGPTSRGSPLRWHSRTLRKGRAQWPTSTGGARLFKEPAHPQTVAGQRHFGLSQIAERAWTWRRQAPWPPGPPAARRPPVAAGTHAAGPGRGLRDSPGVRVKDTLSRDRGTVGAVASRGSRSLHSWARGRRPAEAPQAPGCFGLAG